MIIPMLGYLRVYVLWIDVANWERVSFLPDWKIRYEAAGVGVTRNITDWRVWRYRIWPAIRRTSHRRAVAWSCLRWVFRRPLHTETIRG